MSNPIVVVRRQARLLELCGASGGRFDLPIPAHAIDVLRPVLSYMSVQHLRGRDAYDQNGNYRPVVRERRHLYQLTDRGRLATGLGMYKAVVDVLRKSGYDVRYIDDTPAGRNWRNPDWEAVDSVFDYRPRQRECLEAIAASDFGGIVCASQGFGKSYLMGALALLYPTARIVVAATTGALLGQLHSDISMFVRPLVGRIGNGECREQRVTVCSVKSLHKLRQQPDIMLLDEVHQLATPEALRSINQITNSINFGFSGSLEREDGAHAVMQAICGPIIFTMSNREAVRHGMVLPIEVRWIPVIMPYNPAQGLQDAAKKRAAFWHNTYRNELIARHVRQHTTGDQQVLIAVSTVDHAVRLWRLLPDFSLCYGLQEANYFEHYMRSGLLPTAFKPLSADAQRKLFDDFRAGKVKKAIATKVWSTGVSFPHLEVLYRADGESTNAAVTQWATRTNRLGSQKVKGVVYDFLDLFADDLVNLARKRRRIYQAQQWTERGWPAAVPGK